MADADMVLVAKDDYYIIYVNNRKNRMYTVLIDFWQNTSDIPNYINDVASALEKLSPGFTLLMDLTRFNGASYEMSNNYVEAQKLAVEAGCKRIAEVIPSNPLIKMLSKDYSKKTGASVMTFNDIKHAERWLDLY